jgi:hypothetical protein
MDRAVSMHTSSAVAKDMSDFARHLSGKMRSFLSRLGLRRVTASLFVSTATNQYWGMDANGDLVRLVSDETPLKDGQITGFDPKTFGGGSLDDVFTQGRLEAALMFPG